MLRRLCRVDAEHLTPRRDQSLHPQAPVGLDPDRHHRRRIVAIQVIGDQLMQARDPGDSLAQASPGQDPAVVVLHLDA